MANPCTQQPAVAVRMQAAYLFSWVHPHSSHIFEGGSKMRSLYTGLAGALLPFCMTVGRKGSLRVFAVLGLVLLSSAVFAADPFPPGALPGTLIGGGLPAGYECSGALWHTGLDKLFTVHDGGTVSYMNANGSGVNNWIIGGDLEGISVADPSSDFIYVGVEHPDSIREFNITTGAVSRTFDLTTWMTGASNSGLEALTFVPDAGDPEGGLFYAGLQSDGKIYSFRLPIKSSASSTTVTHVSTITPVAGRTDISGLHYDVD